MCSPYLFIRLHTSLLFPSLLIRANARARKSHMSMLPKLMEVGNIDTATNAWEERQKIVNAYLEPALQVYFSRLGTNPFEEVKP